MAKQAFLISGTVLVASAVFAGRAAAQPQYSQPAFRDGFYVGLGAGIGGLKFEVDGEDVTREESGTGTLRLGSAVSERLLIGANIGGWTKYYGDIFANATATLVGISAEATYYPIVNPSAIDVFVRAGLGFSRFTLEVDGTGSDDIDFEEGGAAFQFGGGVEKRLGRSFAIGAGIDYHVATFDEGYIKANYWDLALTLTWY